MKRPTSVTVFGILNILFSIMGLLGLALSMVMLAKPGSMPNPVLDIAKDQPVYAAWMKASLVIGTICSVVLLVSGIGLLRLKAWARLAAVFLSVASIILAILGGFLNYVYLYQPSMEKASRAQGPEKMQLIAGAVGGTFGGCFSVGYYTLLLIFMTRPKVVAAFELPMNPGSAPPPIYNLVTFHPLPRSAFEHSADVVAPQLLGHYLVRRTDDFFCGGVIVEAEAYLVDDPACHSYRGLTARNKSMFGPPGHAYVYLIYGMHFCFNAVCRPADFAEAVLIRAIEVNFGEESMRQRRGLERVHSLTSGPAKLCQALAIDRTLDGHDLCHPSAPVMIAENPDRNAFLEKCGPLTASRRIGITQAAELPLRYYLPGSPFVSKR